MAKGGKSKFVMVLLESLISGHKVVAIRPRIKEEIQMLRYDPYVERHVVYKEIKKIKGAAR
ncbi:hypothetical protein DERF_013868 [Dermatophagoides farinae]|uniref:Large ribosomal subunit protein bL33m n=1 Tax=Dermatophagoides farinae TaxID=6954 RepID=A0A922HQE4_DERFA|nr:hypothetical protein DERF_013868 [Dermatophagoides farinae]